MDIMSDSEEKTPTVSPDKGATGETGTSSKTMEAGMQTGLSKEEQEAHLLKDYGNTLLEMLDEIRSRDPEAYWDIIIETLFKCFARENRDKTSKEPDFLNLNRLEALEDEHWKKSGSVPDGLKAEVEQAWEWVEFQNYVMLLKEARACFGHGIECIISYINKHKGEHYYMNCMSHSDKEK